MVLTVRNKNCGSIYYVTQKMYENSRDIFELVEDEKDEEVVEVKQQEEESVEEDPLEVLREELRNRGISFHPNCGEKKLRKKLEESE